METKMKRRASERGQSLVELALCLPLLVLILLGVLDFGRVFNAYIVITNAARNGAYYGSMHSLDTNCITQRVIDEAAGSGVTLSSDNVSVSSSGEVGTPISVTVSYDFPLLSSYVLGTGVLHLRSSIEMVIIQ